MNYTNSFMGITPAAALCGALALGAATTSNPTEAQFLSGAAVEYSTGSVTETPFTSSAAALSVGDDDVMDVGVPNSDMIAWGRSMMGGDTSQMLDI